MYTLENENLIINSKSEGAKLRLLDGRINLDEYGIVMKIIERYGL